MPVCLEGRRPPSRQAEGGFRRAGLEAEHAMRRFSRGFDLGGRSADVTRRVRVSPAARGSC